MYKTRKLLENLKWESVRSQKTKKKKNAIPSQITINDVKNEK